ncbi:MAG TPA: peptide deformylase [Chloroflexota bacterium]|jgi:peptide deformylase|nr:peptide deformylase [Chloroflexota bacterium]
MIRPILVVGNPVLRQKAKKVSQIDKPIQRLIDDMIETMKAAPGVGLAAPQIGVPLRLAVIDVDDTITVIVNPEIIKRIGDVELDEGCLSVPGFWGRLNRADRVSVKALDRHGKELRIRDAEGLLAQALQHEIDHLDGYLYVDRMDTLDKLQRAEPLRKREVDAREARRAAGLEVDEDEEEDEEVPVE